jgi:uncharacterized DUF497 family protein
LARYDVQIDERNQEHVTAHGVSASEVEQVFWNEPVIRRNRRGRRAPFIAVGQTDGGSRVVVPFEFVGRLARPITAWRA